MIAPEKYVVAVDTKESQGLIELDAGFFFNFPGGSHLGSLPAFHTATWEQPAWRIGVAHQQDLPGRVAHENSCSKGQAAGKPENWMQYGSCENAV